MKEIISESLNIIINGVVITDPSKQDNPIIYVNNAFTKITGYKPDEVLGKNCRFLQGKDTDGEQLNKLRKAVKERKPVSVILKNYKKNKQIFWNELYISPINYKGKAYFIGIQHDVTERVRAEMRLEKYKQELELMVDQRTKKIREANSQLLKEIEENKEARKKIMLLSEKLLMYGKNINKSISESEKLNDKEQKIKQQLLTKHTTIKHLSELTNLPKSTVSTVKKRLLQKNINQVIVPNLKLFNLITLVIYRNEQPIVLPDDAFLSIKGKDSGFYLTANKTWEDFNKSQMVTNLKQPEIHHFIKKNTEIEFLGQKFQETKLNQNHAKTLYGVIKHNNTKVAAKRTEQTIQTIAKHLKELKKQGNIQTFYYEKPELLDAIELVSEEGNFLTIKNQQKTFGVNMLKGWLSIKESTEVLIPVKEASINLDFSNSIKNNYLVDF